MQSVPSHKTKSGNNATMLYNHFLLLEKKWYAIYTRPRYEKKVFEQLQKAGIDCYLPLQITVKQWSDRKKKVSEPLFSCYLFVNITSKEYYKALNIPGIVRYITFDGKAVPIPEKQIQLIKNLLEHNIEMEEIPDNLMKGSQVEIKSGQFTGLTGELIQFANNTRVILRIGEINKALLVNIPLQYLRQIG